MSDTHIIRRNRETGTIIDLWKDCDGWTLHCAEHGRVCSWPTQKQALKFMPWPSNWCDECCQEVLKNE